MADARAPEVAAEARLEVMVAGVLQRHPLVDAGSASPRCGGCAWAAPKDEDAQMAHYAHLAAVLCATDNLLVAHRPDPLEREEGEIADSWDREGGYSVTVWDQHPDEVQLAYNFEPSEPMTPREAAALGLSLVAAAGRAATTPRRRSAGNLP